MLGDCCYLGGLRSKCFCIEKTWTKIFCNFFIRDITEALQVSNLIVPLQLRYYFMCLAMVGCVVWEGYMHFHQNMHVYLILSLSMRKFAALSILQQRPCWVTSNLIWWPTWDSNPVPSPKRPKRNSVPTRGTTPYKHEWQRSLIVLDVGFITFWSTRLEVSCILAQLVNTV